MPRPTTLDAVYHRGVQRLALALLLAMTPSLAHADAVAHLAGNCPPGLQRSLVGHGSLGCAPRTCTATSQCGPGARCNAIHECWAPRHITRDPQSLMQSTVVGLCASDRTCAEGVCRARRQCEPTAPTPSWDPTTHAFTGIPYHASIGGIALAIGLASVIIARRR